VVRNPADAGKDHCSRDIAGWKEAPTNADRRDRFEALYQDLMPRVLGYALRRTDPDRAHDVVAETFTIAWRRLEAVPSGDGALPWLLATARNVLANERRRLRAGVIGSVGTVADHAEDVVGITALAEAFNALGVDDRDTLALVAWDGLSGAEAAKATGCSPATFAVRLHRARRRLTRLLAEQDVHRPQEGTA
jgi:RNA polymerase sigma factor (sigma-70 family)